MNIKAMLSWSRSCLLIVSAVLVAATPLQSQSPPWAASSPILTDDQLVNSGTASYNKGDYIGAVSSLYAYMQRNPALMSTNSAFANQVISAYIYSVNQLMQVARDRDTYLAQLAQVQAQLQSKNSDEGSTTAGLGRAPKQRPTLTVPPH